MPSIQIKDVPEETHAFAAPAGRDSSSVTPGVPARRLIEEVGRPTVDEVVDRAGGRAGGSVPFSAATDALREDRARR